MGLSIFSKASTKSKRGNLAIDDDLKKVEADLASMEEAGIPKTDPRYINRKKQYDALVAEKG